jgi:hypothetical protein
VQAPFIEQLPSIAMTPIVISIKPHRVPTLFQLIHIENRARYAAKLSGATILRSSGERI